MNSVSEKKVGESEHPLKRLVQDWSSCVSRVYVQICALDVHSGTVIIYWVARKGL